MEIQKIIRAYFQHSPEAGIEYVVLEQLVNHVMKVFLT